MPDRLSVRVRHSTRTDHAAAQGSGFLDALAAGRLPWQAYAELTAQHWFVYEALESAAGVMADDPVAGEFVFPELTRLPSLEADLEFMYGPDWPRHIAALAATTSYCARLRHAAAGSPVGFVAHHYTRYLGDLSGGQYLGAAIADVFGLNGDGHRFFVFTEIDPAAFKALYRSRLDLLPWSEAEEEDFLGEVAEAYSLNTALLTELGVRWS